MWPGAWAGEPYESMQRYGIEPIVTDVKGIYDAVLLYLKGKLPDLMERLH